MGIDQLTLCAPPLPVWLAVIFLQKRSDILQGGAKKRQSLTICYYYYYYGYLHFYLLHRLPFGFRTIAGWQKRENMYQDSTVRQLSHCLLCL